MQTKDFYKILDITDMATDSEIKSAYRKMARKYHPDVAGSTAENVKRFKDINEAYDTLIDKRKRYDYDALRRLYSYASGTAETAKTESDSFHQHSDLKTKYQTKNAFSGIWEDFLNYQQQKEYNRTPLPENGTDITTEVVITISEAVNGTTKKINILHTKPCANCGGRKFINGGRCQKCNGSGLESEHKKLTVKVPANVKNGYKIRIAGEGNQGTNGGRNGNLYLLIKIEKDFNFKYDGINVLRTVPITPYEAVLGANIEIPVDGGKITMKILPNTNSGQKFRLQGQGMSKNGVTGDLIVTVEIKIPNNITEEEKELYRKLAKFGSNNIRKDI